MASAKSNPPVSQPVRHRELQRIALVPFVAVLYAYCAGGPFGFEAMVSTAGPGMALLFILIVPLLFSVPMVLATAEMASAMPVECGFYRWSRAAFGDFWGFQCGWWNWTGTFLMSGAYGVMLADYIGQLTPMQNRWKHWLIAFAFLAVVAYLNIRGIRLVGNLTLGLLLYCSKARYSPPLAFPSPCRKTATFTPHWLNSAHGLARLHEPSCCQWRFAPCSPGSA